MQNYKKMKNLQSVRRKSCNLAILQSCNRSGFTLIEVIIYSAILAIFIGVSFSFVSTILGNTDNLLERNEVVVNQTFVERKLNWVMNGATKITTPAANSSSTTTLSVNGNDATIYPALISFANNKIDLSLAGGASTTITNNRVKVISFRVDHFSNSQSTSTIKFSATFEDKIFPAIVITSTISYVLPR